MDSDGKAHRPETAGATESVARFEIRLTRCLNPDGTPCGELPPLARDAEALRALYRAMVWVRMFDRRAIALQRTGQLGTYGASLGQEAVSAALGCVMRPEDVLLPTYREYAAQFQRGVDPADILLYWGGDERGMAFAQGRGVQDFPICIPVASHVPHAAGVAFAFKQRREPRVAVCVLGDGGTSKGDFYEALNVAGAWRLPLVVLVNNNQWAISVPRAAQSAAQTLAQKAIAAGIPGEQVDGNDVIALCTVLERALARARSGAGASLIEALTYRLGDHTTADDASRYRDEAEVQAAWQREPLRRLRAWLAAQGGWDEAREKQLLADCEAEVEAAVKRYETVAPRTPATMFEHLYAELPAAYRAQRDALEVGASSSSLTGETDALAPSLSMGEGGGGGEPTP
ncbi:MAG TPA: pyruvate dehydrogenase (acetyl-transferring) E1 component subunit alpha [Nevskiales bacterium]|nr:pyruvate dehydrogenase (acetyl-transferring) E1 component subunit alpha [Nevskiales bacterium]